MAFRQMFKIIFLLFHRKLKVGSSIDIPVSGWKLERDSKYCAALLLFPTTHLKRPFSMLLPNSYFIFVLGPCSAQINLRQIQVYVLFEKIEKYFCIVICVTPILRRYGFRGGVNYHSPIHGVYKTFITQIVVHLRTFKDIFRLFVGLPKSKL